MRIPGILLLLLMACATLAYPQLDDRFLHPRSAAAASSVPGVHHWRYSREARFHDILGVEAQEFTSSEPEETAARVCAELGGEVGHVAAATENRKQLPFMCRFTEPDVTMFVEFGELDRIPVR